MISDSINIFKNMEHPLRVLNVIFDNEISQDVGGVSREYFYTIMKEMLTPSYSLFDRATSDQFSYKIAEDSIELVGWQDLYYFFG